MLELFFSCCYNYLIWNFGPKTNPANENSDTDFLQKYLLGKNDWKMA